MPCLWKLDFEASRHEGGHYLEGYEKKCLQVPPIQARSKQQLFMRFRSVVAWSLCLVTGELLYVRANGRRVDVFGSAILEVAIGIIFIYILVCFICSAIREGIEAWLKTRAAYLEHGIRELLHDRDAQGIVRDLYNHPLIFGLFSDEYNPAASSKRLAIFASGCNLPSYIPTRNFALALIDLAARGPKTDVVTSDPNGPVLSLETVRMNIANLKNQAVQRVLLSALDTAQGDMNKFRTSLENWYDSSMDRVSGWYKRSTQWIILGVGLVVAVGMNVNTITIADYLFRNEVARSVIVAQAEKAVSNPGTSSENYAEAKKDLDSMSLPIGWGEGWGSLKRGEAAAGAGYWNNLFAPLVGWLMTTFAATMGAPFWFDMLNKVMVIRSTVKPYEKSPEEASEDRQVLTPQTPSVSAAVPAQPGGANLSALLRSPQPKVASSPRDVESSIDGCDVAIVNETSDEELPAARGGVA